MKTDQTNKRNIQMFFSYIGIIVLCMVAIAVIAVLAGTSVINPSLGMFDRPRASLSFHDHRL
jgi:lipopolysaccharide/colanic/teichoic acid biosynthesis glycosyltransferase